MGASTVTLTVRSINGGVLPTSVQATFNVAKITQLTANLNPYTAKSVTEAGDAANQLSAWELYGAKSARLGWELTDAAGDRTVKLFSNANHDKVVAQGTRTGNGAVILYSANESGISGKVTIAYSADDVDAANLVYDPNYVAENDTQLPGATQFAYEESDSRRVKYTVNESVSAINAAINGDSTFIEETITLTNAQIRTLGSVPVDIIAAPGAGYAIEVISAFVNYTYATDAFAGNMTADLIYTTTANEIATATNAFSGAASKITKFVTSAGVIMPNEGVTIKMDTGDPTVGGTEAGTAVVSVTYKVTAL